MTRSDDGSTRRTGGTRSGAWTAAALTSLVVASAVSPAYSQLQPFRRAKAVQQISSDPFDGILGSQADTEVEPHVAVDPNDSQVVVAVFQQGRYTNSGAVALGYAASHDGGLTWTEGSLPNLTAATGGSFERATDPVVAIGPDGRVYAASHAFTGDCLDAITISRSNDGGLTFGNPITVDSENECDNVGANFDKEWVAVDTHPTSPHFGRVYVAWTAYRSSTGAAPLLLRWSDTDGLIWSLRRTIDTGTFSHSEGVIPLVQPNGDLVIVYSGQESAVASDPRFMVAQKSDDGGQTFEAPAVISGEDGVNVPGLRSSIFLPSWNLPAANVDPVTGDLWASWADARFRSDGGNDIVLTRSIDGGATWDALRVVNPPKRESFFTPAVAAHGGRMVVTFQSVRLMDDVVRTWFTSSADGALFKRARRLGRRGDLDWAAQTSGVDFLGEYSGAAASADTAYAIWIRPFRPRIAQPTPHQTVWAARLQ